MSSNKSQSKDRPNRAPSTGPGQAKPRPRLTGWRKWVARLLMAILAPTLFLSLLELGLWLFGYGYDTSYFIRSEDGKAYQSNPRFAWRFFGPELSRNPIPTILSAKKPEGTYRIFVLGGSAAKGTPESAFSFARILEVMLNQRYPAARFEVINTAVTAINSHVVLSIIGDCADFDSDLYIVYLGNNEVIGPYGAGTVFRGYNPSRGAIRASIFLRSTRTGQLLGDLVGAVGGDDPKARKEWGGLAMFLENRLTEDDPRLKTVYENYRANLIGICGRARRDGVDIILSTVATNIKDCAPFSSVHGAGLSKEKLARWDDLYSQGVAQQEVGRYGDAIDRYRSAAEIDDRHAQLHFRLGRCLLALREHDQARRHLTRARDLDAIRLRADTQISRIVREVAGELSARGVHLVDGEQILGAAGDGPEGMPGWEVLYEHVHMNFFGNYTLAAAMFEQVGRLLPADIRRSAGENVVAPSQARCAEALRFTDFERFHSAAGIHMMTSRPPFPPQRGALAEKEMNRLEAALSPESLERMAEEYERALARRPDDLLMRDNYADLQFYRGRYDAAVEQWRALLTRYPHESDWHLNLGKALARQEMWAEAIAEFRQVLRQYPGFADAHRRIGVALFKMGKTELAIEEFEKALSVQPGYALGHFELGKILLAESRPADAEGHLASAVELEPDAADPHYYLGQARARQGKTDEALPALREAVRLRGDLVGAHMLLGRLASESGRLDEAIAAFGRAAAAKEGNGPALFNLGRALHRKGLFEEAVASLQKALAINPGSAATHYLLAQANYRLALVAPAREHFRRAVELDGSFAKHPYTLAATLSGPDAEAQAMARLREDAEARPDWALAHYRLGRALQRTGQVTAAVAHFRRAIEIEPRWPMALNTLAWLYATHPDAGLRNGEQAVALAERAIEVVGLKNPWMLDTLAAARANAEQFSAAAETAGKALELAEQAGNAALAEEIRGRLALYRAGKPYRQPSP